MPALLDIPYTVSRAPGGPDQSQARSISCSMSRFESHMFWNHRSSCCSLECPSRGSWGAIPDTVGVPETVMEPGRLGPGWHHPSRTQTPETLPVAHAARSMLSPASLAAAYGVASQSKLGILKVVPT